MPTLAQLNSMNEITFHAEALRCCGSIKWASTLAAMRPYRIEADLFAAAEKIWNNLNPADWLEAFNRHPKIGAKIGDNANTAWAKNEQSGMKDAAEAIRNELARGNADYERKFGYIYLVCATGKSADELLRLLKVRLKNDPSEEIKIAADEQAKITRLRLEKLLKS